MTELIWDGKYDKDGRRVAPVRIALPFQTVETVNESAQARAQQYDLWQQGQPTAWRNRLIWGDKKYVLPSLLAELAGKVNLIYIDPPFATGADFSFTTTLPESDESFTKEPSMIEQKAYRDIWGRGLDSYLQWFYETVVVLRELLAEDGSMYVHLDYHVSHYVKSGVLDEAFGPEAFLSEIIWQRTNAHNITPRYYLRIHDVILVYAKSQAYTWNTQFTQYSPEQLRRYKPDDEGRLYTGQDLTMSASTKARNFEWRGSRPAANRGWALSYEQLERLWAEGRILTKVDGSPRLDGMKVYLDETEGKRVTDLWTDISRVGNTSDERIDYPTQKPEALLERIIRASSNEGDLVLDCFCGSGTTAAVAEKLGRRWITCDLGRFAIHTARKRLLSIANVKPFVVQNLGKYERQAWQVAEFAEGDATQAPAAQLAYRRFMLDLYRAQPLEGHTWLHGVRDGRLVHVSGVEAPVAEGDVRQIVKAFWKITGEAATNGVDILGWDFAFELNEVARQMAAEANVHVKFKRVPREVLEKRAVEQGDIKFFELAALGAQISQQDREGVGGTARDHGPHVTVTLSDFIMPPDDVPEDVRHAVKHWSQWIDYWAVDWSYQGDTFHNMAQTYRTRKDPKLQTSLSHTYAEPGVYAIVVKVIDILGNDTTKSLKVEVR
ncbi:MAG: site-specific DNA-methyltransferase [Ktedonobacterales bacterium]|nr:site-specific DNA-methyltransferase [Ktedonobacterales bacterium]